MSGTLPALREPNWNEWDVRVACRLFAVAFAAVVAPHILATLVTIAVALFEYLQRSAPGVHGRIDQVMGGAFLGTAQRQSPLTGAPNLVWTGVLAVAAVTLIVSSGSAAPSRFMRWVAGIFR